MAPNKEVRVKQRTKPWMSSEILNYSDKGTNIYEHFETQNNLSDYKLFVKCLFTIEIRSNKKEKR